MAEVSATTEIDAAPERVWAAMAAPAAWGDWLDIHQGFAGEVPSSLVPGGAFSQRVRVLGMPAEVRWTVVGLQEPVRLELEGTGPMGITLVARYGIAPGARSEVTARMEFRGASVAMVGPQLESEVGRSLRTSLHQLKARVEGTPAA